MTLAPLVRLALHNVIESVDNIRRQHVGVGCLFLLDTACIVVRVALPVAAVAPTFADLLPYPLVIFDLLVSDLPFLDSHLSASA